MTLSIKSIGGTINEPPVISDLKVLSVEKNLINIYFRVLDVERTVCRNYLILDGEKTDISRKCTFGEEEDSYIYCIDNLEPGSSHKIQIESNDGHDIGFSAEITGTTRGITIYELIVDKNNSNPETRITYGRDAEGMESQRATNTSLNGWEDKWPYNEIRIVGIKKGEITKEVNKMNKIQYIDGTSIPSDVDVFVEFPKVYWNFETIDSNTYKIVISDYPIPGGDCFAHNVKGVEKDYVYIGAFIGHEMSENGKTVVVSRPGKEVTTSLQDWPDVEYYAKNLGEGYQIVHYYRIVLVQILYLLAFKNFDSQNSLGKGQIALQSYQKKNTAGTATKGMVYGNKNSGNEQLCFLGIEDLYGGLPQLFRGAYVDSYNNKRILVEKNSSGEYQRIETNTSWGDMYFVGKEFGTNIGTFMGESTGGSSSTHLCDTNYRYQGAHGQFGERTDYTFEDGIFSMNFTNQKGHTIYYSRIEFIK